MNPLDLAYINRLAPYKVWTENGCDYLVETNMNRRYGGMENLPVVLFDRGISIPRAHARIHKVFTLATVATLQHYLKISVLRVATR